MWSRRRIDVGWADLLVGLTYAIRRSPRAGELATDCDWFDPQQSVVTLSVRSGFDLLLTACNFPAGSEVLMSAVNLRDMASIVEAHDLIPVPVDVDPETMLPTPETLSATVSSKARMLVLAQLCGAISDLSALAQIARAHELILVEDAAQAFAGPLYKGSPLADVTMFSFGPLKTATALGGGIVWVRSSSLLRQMHDLHSCWPMQASRDFRQRILVYTLLKFAASKTLFGLLMQWWKARSIDPDKILGATVRNFHSEDIPACFRFRPCGALERMIRRRIQRFDRKRLERRGLVGRRLAEEVAKSGTCLVSRGVDHHCWWLAAVALSNPNRADALRQALRKAGFDSALNQQLLPLPLPAGHSAPAPHQALWATRDMVYLPIYPELSDQAVEEMIDVIGSTLCSDSLNEHEP